jgi:deoxyribodipyrimidine photo-lyase
MVLGHVDRRRSGEQSAQLAMGRRRRRRSAPYFRIFNPVLQAEKFDSYGAYVRQWVPELERLEAAAIHSPWQASSDALSKAGVVLGKTYPKPIVDHAQARARALAAFAKMRGR